MTAAMVVARNKNQNIPFPVPVCSTTSPNYSLNYPLAEDSDRRDYPAGDEGRVLIPIYLLGWNGAVDAYPGFLPREQLGIHRPGLL